MSVMWMRFFLGFPLAATVAAAAVAAGALTLDGAGAATAVGALCFLGGGLPWATILMLFFVTSSALSHLASRTRGPAHDIAAKSARRDAVQVMANGGIPALCALLHILHPSSVWPAAFAGAVAAATADTWGTEIGALSPTPPVLITTGRRVPPGTSGGVTALGCGGAALGALVISIGASLLLAPISGVLAVALAGLIGSVVDSVLGATVQEIRLCPVCAARTEQVVHRACGARTVRIRGIPHLDNDAVNALACAAGSLATLVLIHPALAA